MSGFVVFLPKYLETQFSLGKSQASVFTGSIAVPGACIGIFIGGCILKRFQLKPKGAVQFVLISNVICLALYALLFLLGCDNLKMAGTTIPYNSGGGDQASFQVNLTAACNFGCECNIFDAEPVCGNNGLTYFSPCHAGCTAFSNTNYTNCACVQANTTTKATTPSGLYAGAEGSQAAALTDYAEVTVVPIATVGACGSTCRTIYPFLILLFFMTFIVASTQMPLLMIVLRSVSEEERSFALGMQFVIFRLFGYIPAPIIFGNLIDSSCLVWKSSCGEAGGRCLIYDIEKFRYKYVGLCASIKIVALAIFTLDWWLVRRRKCLEKLVPLSANELVGSIISLDKLFEEKSLNEAQGFSGEVIMGDCLIAPVEIDANRKILVKVSRHLRSKSCDVKLGRSNSRDSADNMGGYRFRAGGHSRNNSRDMENEATRVLPQNFRYILNHLKTNNSHFRNHSYGQEFSFLPNNAIVRLDNNCANQFLQRTFGATSSFKHSRDYHEMLKNNTAKMMLSKNNSVELAEEVEHKYTHSRNNSKDLTTKITNSLKSLIEDVGSNSNLRHRRTNSRDMNVAAARPGCSSSGVQPEHKRTLSAKNSAATVVGNPLDGQEIERQLLCEVQGGATTAGEDSEATEL